MGEFFSSGQWIVVVLTGLFALAGSWVGSKLGKSTEHWQWLRNEKVKEYIAAVAYASHLTQSLVNLHQNRDAETRVLEEDYIIPTLVLGTRRVNHRLLEFAVAAKTAARALEKEPREQYRKLVRERINELHEAFGDLLLEVRRDLRVKD